MPYHDDFTEFMPTDDDEWWAENEHLHDPHTKLPLDQFPPPPPEHLIDPGFPEHEVDTHFDPDHGREDMHPPHEWSPEENDWEHQRAHEDHRLGAILRQAEQWPHRLASSYNVHLKLRDGTPAESLGADIFHDARKQADALAAKHKLTLVEKARSPEDAGRMPMWLPAYRGKDWVGNVVIERSEPSLDESGPMGPNAHQYAYAAKADLGPHASVDHQFYNRDPAQGTTAPRMVGGDPEGIVSVEPPGDHDGARVMYPDETGLEYPVIARPSEHGGYDVLHPLG